MKKLDLVVYIGRMQPATKAHIANINEALNIGKKVLVLLGSSHQPRTIKNPWSWTERASMITSQISPADAPRIIYQGLHDYRYNDQKWVQQVQQLVSKHTLGLTNPTIGIIGCKKDTSSYYLDYFPQWKMIEMDTIEDVNATTVRNEYFSGHLFMWHDRDHISPELQQYLKEWMKSEQYPLLQREYQFIEMYKKGWETSPYPPTFVTVDSVVIQSGHVLLIHRKSSPGSDLWAFPGGFLGQDEFIFDAALRELREETKLKVPTPVLKGSLIGQKVFDNPTRSLRGRTISHAFAFQLEAGELSKVKGSDDAKYAKWFPIDVIPDMEEIMFEDHIDMIRWAISLCK